MERWDAVQIVLAAREPLTVAALVELVDGVVFQEIVERFVEALASLFPLRKTGDEFDVIVAYYKSVPDALTDKTVKRKPMSNELCYRHLSFVDVAAGNILLSTACLRVLRSSNADAAELLTVLVVALSSYTLRERLRPPLKRMRR